LFDSRSRSPQTFFEFPFRCADRSVAVVFVPPIPLLALPFFSCAVIRGSAFSVFVFGFAPIFLPDEGWPNYWPFVPSSPPFSLLVVRPQNRSEIFLYFAESLALGPPWRVALFPVFPCLSPNFNLVAPLFFSPERRQPSCGVVLSPMCFPAPTFSFPGSPPF